MELARKEDIGVVTEVGKKDLLSQQTLTVVSFYMGDFLFGISAEKILEINKDLEITPVPLSENYILGIMNLRGQIITVIDLAKKIELQEEIQPKINLIIKTEEDAPVSFVIEKIGDILQIPVAKLESTPEKIEGLNKKYVEKIYQLPDRLLLLLDLNEILKN
jgi:purine-binding chemotaxis protein CheW